MIPVEQTHAGEVNGRPRGNCFAACVASILECSLDDLPELDPFAEDHDVKMNEALSRDFGVYTVTWQTCLFGQAPVWVGDEQVPSLGYWIAGVPSLNLGRDPESQTCRWHAVVMRGHEIAHDPSTKIKRLDFSDGPVHQATIFVPLDPSARAMGALALDVLAAAAT
jgi:hypothetical protein